MRNWTQVKKTLNEHFKGIKEINDGISNIMPYIGLFAVGAATGGAPLTIPAIITASAAAAKGSAGILAYLTEPSKWDNLEDYEK